MEGLLYVAEPDDERLETEPEVPYVALEEPLAAVLTPLLVPVAEDLTAWPELGLAVLATDEMDDLDALPDTLEALVAVEALVPDTPVLERVIEELLTPADLEEDPSPLLVVDPVVAILGL